MNLEEKLYRENLQLASVGSRFCAFLIDKFLISFVFFIIYWNDFSQTNGDYAMMIGLISNVIWQFICLSIAYEVIFLVLYGATLGKIFLKIRVLGVMLLDSPSVLHALIRTVMKILSENLFYFPYLFSLFSPFKQALHDYMAKTIVIRNA